MNAPDSRPDPEDLPAPVLPGDGRAPFRVFGVHRDHPRATELAQQVHGALLRYTYDVVEKHRLCPFFHGKDSGMGAIGIVLSTELDVGEATDAIERIGASIVHLVYPLYFGEASPFERFGNRLSESVRKRLKEPLVHACFHPSMVGGHENAYRLIGLLRQAPDPFVQFIPAGLQQGGTVLAGDEVPSGSHAEARFQRLVEAVPPGQPTASDVLAKLEALRQEKAQTYAALAREIAGGR